VQGQLLLTYSEDSECSRRYMLALTKQITSSAYYDLMDATTGKTSNYGSTRARLLWWLCLIRDREVALFGRRSEFIEATEVYIPTLDRPALECCFGSLREHGFPVSAGSETVKDKLEQLSIALCMEKIRLFCSICFPVLMERILPVDPSAASRIVPPSSTSLPDAEARVAAVEKMLEWRNALPLSAELDESFNNGSVPSQDWTKFHGAVLHLSFYIHLIKLVQQPNPTSSPATKGDDVEPGPCVGAQKPMAEICRILRFLFNTGLFEKLPCCVVSSLLSIFVRLASPVGAMKTTDFYEGFDHCAGLVAQSCSLGLASNLKKRLLHILVNSTQHMFLEKNPVNHAPIESPQVHRPSPDVGQSPPGIVIPFLKDDDCIANSDVILEPGEIDRHSDVSRAIESDHDQSAHNFLGQSRSDPSAQNADEPLGPREFDPFMYLCDDADDHPVDCCR